MKTWLLFFALAILLCGASPALAKKDHPPKSPQALKEAPSANVEVHVWSDICVLTRNARGEWAIDDKGHTIPLDRKIKVLWASGKEVKRPLNEALSGCKVRVTYLPTTENTIHVQDITLLGDY